MSTISSVRARPSSRAAPKSIRRAAEEAPERIIHIAKTNPMPVCSRHSAARSNTCSPSRAKVMAGSPMIRAPSFSVSIRPTSGADELHSGSKPRNSRNMILRRAAEVRDDSSSAIRRTSFRLSTLIARTTLRTCWREPTQTSGTTTTSGIRWYSMTGTNAMSTSPPANKLAQRAGTASVNSTAPRLEPRVKLQISGAVFR